jgi:hypothetical protein
MHPLIYLAIVGSASAGIVFWQQASIERVQQENRSLSTKVAATRTAIELNRDSLAESHQQMNRIRGELRSARREQGIAEAEQLARHTPEREGWWPKDREYFYLAKSYLPQVRFRTCKLPVAEAHARLTNGTISSLTVIPDRNPDEALVSYNLFYGGRFNRDMAALLGMTTAEADRTDEIYAGLIQSVGKIEAARIQRVDPPEPVAVSGTLQFTVARMPDLSEEVEPLIAAANGEITQLLGHDRAALLIEQAEDYFRNYRDQLGRQPREFRRCDTMVFINYTGKRGGYSSPQTINLPIARNSHYTHLFGPGAPCELK